MHLTPPRGPAPVTAVGANALAELLFDEAGSGRCLVAPDGTVLRANPEWLRATGLTLDEAIGRDVLELLPQAREAAIAARTLAPAGQRTDLPRHARWVAGRETWWEGTLSPVPMEAGCGLLVTLRDVTADATASEAAVEEALCRSDARAAAVSRNMRDHLVLLEAVRGPTCEIEDWRYVDANEGALELLAKTRDGLIGRTVREVLGARAAGVHERMVRVLETGVRERYEATFRDRALLITIFPVDADTVGSAAVDVTERVRGEEERRRVEAALRESEARYRLLFDSIDEGFCIIEVLFDAAGAPADYRFVEVNRAFEKQTGLVDAAGKRMRELAPAHEEHWFQIYGRVALTGEPIRFENRAEALGRVYDVYAFRVGPPEGRRVAILFSDISERKRVEEKLREADRRKSEFLGVLSHELRNPLAPIRNSTLILERAPAGSPAAVRAREVIQRQTEHLSRLVDDLLDVERIARGKVQLSRTRLDLRDVVRKTCDDHRSVLEQGGVEMRLDLPFGPVWVEGDATRISQVVGNLLHNAAKFTAAGGRVEVEVASREENGLIAVRDTGAGMIPEDLERIFQPFAQGEQGLARTEGGLGLGLALVKGLVELHGGSVRARSKGPGRGSELTVRLPLAAAGATTLRRRGRAETAPRRILVIEDNLDAGQTLADLLELEGHRAHVASDGREGIALARELKPDVVLCDIGLPDMSGHDVARALRSDATLRSTRLIALTGYAQPEDRQRAREAGFDGHLPKPPDLEELWRSIEERS
ncbi:ATP-binding protein [Anaeromyxobacter sp. Fw109-5]|uniref:hybrid sensor histidine kinase/response regulator n=1 Tax=Anaeromyxobacter sp. (strain Fw109-5) TaxID=404589 RepID=UPI0000ED75BF|nr:ATP-binding protein [Anaeromyxobacter sp. Fw109-5]ABS26558.1 PAS/PAC sensor hybrid histidine kinase [Anaeromyxobacter sp. Fw109-5]